jgi:hypothetical protein
MLLFQLNTKEFGIAGLFIILGIGIGAEGDGILGKELNEMFNGHPTQGVAGLVMNYFPEFLWEVLDLCIEKERKL